MTESRTGWGYALAAVVLWGASFVATRVALGAMTPFGLLAVRLVIGSLFLVTLIGLGDRATPWPRRKDRRDGIVLGVVLGVHLGIQAVGLQWTTAIHTAWIVGAMPITMALGASLFGRASFSGSGYVGLLIALLGIGVVTLRDVEAFEKAGLGDALQLSTCVTWAIYSVIAESPREPGYSTLRGTTMTMAIASLIAIAGAAAMGWTHAPMTLTTWGAVVFLGAFCSGLAFWLWSKALQVDHASRMGLTLYAEPFVTLILASAILDEPWDERTLLGGAIVLAGVWVAGRKPKRPS